MRINSTLERFVFIAKTNKMKRTIDEAEETLNGCLRTDKFAIAIVLMN